MAPLLKLILSAILATFTLCGNAQITKEHNIPRAGDALLRMPIALTSAGAHGDNAVWDFSRSATDKPGSTLRYTQPEDSIHTLYSLHRGTRHTYRLAGDTLLLTGYENRLCKVGFNEPPVALLLTLHYGDSIEGGFTGEGEYCDRLHTCFAGQYKTVADGRGTLITPQGDTLRQVMRLHGIRTARIGFSPLHQPAGADTARAACKDVHLREDIYTWYARGCRYPVVGHNTITDTGTQRQISQQAWYLSPETRQQTMVYAESIPEETGAEPAGGSDLSPGFSYTVSAEPGSPYIDINYHAGTATDVKALLADASGIVYTAAAHTGSASGTLRISRGALRMGQYIIYIKAFGKTHVEKINIH